MKKRLYILSLLCLLLTPAMAVQTTSYPCGSWLQLTATPYDDLEFVEWSDGVTDPVRLVEVVSDATYIAYFSSKCVNYTNWPVVAAYDWLLMLNVKAINEMGFYFEPEDVTWYRVVGTVDDLDAEYRDDEVVCKGFYLTLAKNLKGTGDYYALIDVSAQPTGELCSDYMRSMIIHYADAAAPKRSVMLTPNVVARGEQLKMVGLDPEERTELFVYSADGQVIEHLYASGDVVYYITSPRTVGCYYLRVYTPTYETTLPFIVR